jgi:hypothetical protein
MHQPGDISGSGCEQKALGDPAELLLRGRVAGPGGFEVFSRAVKELATGSRISADDPGNLAMGVVEYVMEQEHGSLQRTQPLKEDEEGKGE